MTISATNPVPSEALKPAGLDGTFSVSFAGKQKIVFVARTVISLLGVTICTLLAWHLDLNLASCGFLHLFLVVLVAVYAGFWEATITSVAAVLSLNYFFVPPLHSLVVS